MWIHSSGNKRDVACHCAITVFLCFDSFFFCIIGPLCAIKEQRETPTCSTACMTVVLTVTFSSSCRVWFETDMLRQSSWLFLSFVCVWVYVRGLGLTILLCLSPLWPWLSLFFPPSYCAVFLSLHFSRCSALPHPLLLWLLSFIQNRRTGQFHRIYPNPGTHTKYAALFSSPRYANILAAKFVEVSWLSSNLTFLLMCS